MPNMVVSDVGKLSRIGGDVDAKYFHMSLLVQTSRLDTRKCPLGASLKKLRSRVEVRNNGSQKVGVGLSKSAFFHLNSPLDGLALSDVIFSLIKRQISRK